MKRLSVTHQTFISYFLNLPDISNANMRINKIYYALTVLFFSFIFVEASAQNQTKTYDINNFDGIAMQTAGQVNVKIGDQYKVSVTAPSKFIERLEVYNSGGRLVIKTKKGDWSWSSWSWSSKDGNPRFEITVPRLREIVTSSSGQIYVDGLIKTRDMKISTSGSGSITLEVESTEVAASTSGSGRLNLKVDCRELSLRMSGSGGANLKGYANNADMRVSGSGNIRALDLKINELRASVSGSGNIKAHVKESINASVSGSGNIRYTGSPGQVNVKSSGSGRISSI